MKMKVIVSLILAFTLALSMSVFAFATSGEGEISVSATEYGVRISPEEATQRLGFNDEGFSPFTTTTNEIRPLDCGYVYVVTFYVFVTSTGETEVIVRNPAIAPLNIMFRDSIVAIEAFRHLDGVDWRITNSTPSSLLFAEYHARLYRDTLPLQGLVGRREINPTAAWRIPLFGWNWTHSTFTMWSPSVNVPQLTIRR